MPSGQAGSALLVGINGEKAARSLLRSTVTLGETGSLYTLQCVVYRGIKVGVTAHFNMQEWRNYRRYSLISSSVGFNPILNAV